MRGEERWREKEEMRSEKKAWEGGRERGERKKEGGNLKWRNTHTCTSSVAQNLLSYLFPSGNFTTTTKHLLLLLLLSVLLSLLLLLLLFCGSKNCGSGSGGREAFRDKRCW